MIIFGGLNGLGVTLLPTSFIDKLRMMDSNVAELTKVSSDVPVITTDTPPELLAPGTCTSDGQLIWRATYVRTTDGVTVPGHWERKRVGETCAIISDIPHVTRGPCTVDHLENCPGGIYVAPTKVMQVGAFTIPVVRSGNVYKWGLDSYGKLTAEQAAQIKEQLSKPVEDGNSFRPIKAGWITHDTPNSNVTLQSMQSGKPTGTLIHTVFGPGDWLTSGGWLGKFGFKDGDKWDWRYTPQANFDRTKGVPIAQFKHPDTGAHYGMWMDFGFVGPEIKPILAEVINEATGEKTPWPTYTTRSVMLRFMVAPMPEKSLLGDLWDWIMSGVKWVVVKFYEGVWDVAEVLSDKLCAMAQTPGAITKTGSQAGPYGAAAGAAVEIALVTADNCPVPNPTPEGKPGPIGPTKKPIPWGLVALGVGVVGLAAVLLTQKPTKTKKAA